VRIDPADTLNVRIGKQILAFQQGGAFWQKHGGADEAFFHGIVEFAVRFENAFIGVDDIAAWREACHKTGIGYGDEAFDAFAAEEAFQDVDGQMVAVRDGHNGHVVFGKTCPDGIVMAINEIGQTVAEMRHRISSRLVDIVFRREFMAERDADSIVMGMLDKLLDTRKFSGDRQNRDMAVGKVDQFVQRLDGRREDPCGIMGADGARLRGDERPFQMEAGHGVTEAMGIDGLVQHGKIPPIRLHGGRRKRWKKACYAFGENLFNATEEGVFRDGRICEIRSKSTVDLQVKAFHLAQNSLVSLQSLAAAGSSQNVAQSGWRRMTEAGCMGESSPSKVICIA